MTEENPSPTGGVASRQLDALADKATRSGGLTVGETLSAMGGTSIPFTILFLALMCMNPVPGPWGMFFGTCLALISLQIMAGSRTLWLPRFVRERHLSAPVIATAVKYSKPLVARVEKVLKPDRMRAFSGRKAQALLGLPVFLLAVAVALPIPFGNFLPVLALSVIATALMERDGLAALIGFGLTLVALGVSTGLVYGLAGSLGSLI